MISIARIFTLPLFLFLGACASIAVLQLNDRFGEPDPVHFDHVQGTPPRLAPDYWSDVRPVLDRRCVSCHACSDAPCQLNLTSYEGLTRGASQIEAYGTPRLVAEAPTRLGIDAQSVLEWRSKGFFPVLNSTTARINQASLAFSTTVDWTTIDEIPETQSQQARGS